ncbi:hypothetical protein EDB86DRAFT_3244425 [Lactarius hatsudake]|nr:hypothetical protein EDB86DRAFT_3244425 [Lactarius hatsudake]
MRRHPHPIPRGAQAPLVFFHAQSESASLCPSSAPRLPPDGGARQPRAGSIQALPAHVAGCLRRETATRRRYPEAWPHPVGKYRTSRSDLAGFSQRAVCGRAGRSGLSILLLNSILCLSPSVPGHVPSHVRSGGVEGSSRTAFAAVGLGRERPIVTRSYGGV